MYWVGVLLSFLTGVVIGLFTMAIYMGKGMFR